MKTVRGEYDGTMVGKLKMFRSEDGRAEGDFHFMGKLE